MLSLKLILEIPALVKEYAPGIQGGPKDLPQETPKGRSDSTGTIGPDQPGLHCFKTMAPTKRFTVDLFLTRMVHRLEYLTIIPTDLLLIRTERRVLHNG